MTTWTHVEAGTVYAVLLSLTGYCLDDQREILRDAADMAFDGGRPDVAGIIGAVANARGIPRHEIGIDRHSDTPIVA